jgi:hypothetical protein
MLHQLLEGAGLDAHLDQPLERVGAFGECCDRYTIQSVAYEGRWRCNSPAEHVPPVLPLAACSSSLQPVLQPSPCCCWTCLFVVALWEVLSCVPFPRALPAQSRHGASCPRWVDMPAVLPDP